MRSRKTVGVVCLITALAIFAGYQQSRQAADPNVNTMDLSAADATPSTPVEPLKIEGDQQAAKPSAPKAAPKKSTAKPASAKAAPSKASATTASTSGAIAADTMPAITPVVESRSVAMKKQDEESIATMISGCLEQDNGMFRLKDTDGNHVPKTRSWKSGFIRKGSAKVDVIDATNRFKLATYVGYRVSVSGALVDREIQAQSVRPSSERCD